MQPNGGITQTSKGCKRLGSNGGAQWWGLYVRSTCALTSSVQARKRGAEPNAQWWRPKQASPLFTPLPQLTLTALKRLPDFDVTSPSRQRPRAPVLALVGRMP